MPLKGERRHLNNMATRKKTKLAVPPGGGPDPLIQRIDEHIAKLAAPGGEGSPRVKKEAERVSRDARAMRGAFESLGMAPRDREELAFHLAEISEELMGIAELLRTICQKGTCTHEQYRYLVGCVSVHWAYHLPKARRIMERVPIPSRPPRRSSK